MLSLAEELQTYGYQEINLNLGCPSGTVAAKNRGAGFLALTDDLDAFLDTIFSRCCCKVSIKTRIGKLDPAEWETILSIYEKYPVEELIIHPRIQQDFYKHPVRMRLTAMHVNTAATPYATMATCSALPIIRHSARHFHRQKKSC